MITVRKENVILITNIVHIHYEVELVDVIWVVMVNYHNTIRHYNPVYGGSMDL
jgi:hypothetical protein